MKIPRPSSTQAARGERRDFAWSVQSVALRRRARPRRASRPRRFRQRQRRLRRHAAAGATGGTPARPTRTLTGRAGTPLYLLSLFEHARSARAAAAGYGVTARVDLADFTLQLQRGSRQRAWRPKFMASIGGRLAYADQPSETTVGFAGWMPHALRRWPAAADKVAFKQASTQRSIATPAACTDPARIGGPFLVKGSSGSFGEGQRGPFLAYDPGSPEQQLAEGEFYENFLPGVIAKAWCWGPVCVALELRRPTTVTGDGRTPLRALVQALADGKSGSDWALVERLARYCGVDGLDAVPAADHEVLVEYRYGSRLADPMQHSINRIASARSTGLAAQFDRAAALLQDTMPRQDDPAHSLLTLDAMVDADGQAWFLEMNCNPLVHPDAYAPLLADAFGVAN